VLTNKQTNRRTHTKRDYSKQPTSLR